MDEPVDGGHGGHLVFEDLVPLREDQVRADHHAAPLVAFPEEGEEHFHFGDGGPIAPTTGYSVDFAHDLLLCSLCGVSWGKFAHAVP